MQLSSRYRGSLLGLACGDAVGTAVEFSRRGSFPPVTDMIGGGKFGLQPGQWTDDTSMALCLAVSLLERDGFDPADQMNRYVNWWQWGYMSSTGECFDIGGTTAQALQRFLDTGEPFSGSMDLMAAGNGSLMRLAPAALFGYPDFADIDRLSAESSRTTHAAGEAVECCRLLGAAIGRALQGREKREVLSLFRLDVTGERVASIARGDYLSRGRDDITGSGYCVDSLEAALWCFGRTDSFEEAVLAAVNLGDDADTTAAITGQLAGAFYGVEAIPAAWLERLAMREEIDQIARRLCRWTAVPDGVASRISAIRGDITRLDVDAIVNAADNAMLGGGGVDGAIHAAAGPGLLEECRLVGGCPTGEARMTGGHRLPARHVIHTVGPVYHQGMDGEARLLRSCYRSSLALAAEAGVETIAFPCISTGIYGYPKAEACDIAASAVADWLRESPLPRKVIFCCFDAEDAQLYAEKLRG